MRLSLNTVALLRHHRDQNASDVVHASLRALEAYTRRHRGANVRVTYHAARSGRVYFKLHAPLSAALGADGLEGVDELEALDALNGAELGARGHHA